MTLRREGTLKLALLFFTLLAACVEAPQDPAPPPLSTALPRPEPSGTALVAVTLSPDERAEIDSAVTRSFAYRGPLQEWSELQRDVSGGERAGPPNPPEQPSSPLAHTPHGLPGLVARPPQVGASSPVSSRYALVVTAPSLPAPVAVALKLAPPHDAEGDVLDPWHGGTIILRAPHYGEGTRVALYALRATGAAPLAEVAVEVTP